MDPASHQRAQHVTAIAVLGMLLGGVGVLGWLVGHVAAYAVTGSTHAHRSHGYMDPLSDGGVLLAAAGVLASIVALVLGHRALRAWVRRWASFRAPEPWLFAAAIPALAFVLVETLEGSFATSGPTLLLVGTPLQAVLGIVVLAAVRSFLAVVVQAVGLLCARPPRPRLATSALRLAAARDDARRIAPIATNAAMRAPPLACA